MLYARTLLDVNMVSWRIIDRRTDRSVSLTVSLTPIRFRETPIRSSIAVRLRCWTVAIVELKRQES